MVHPIEEADMDVVAIVGGTLIDGTGKPPMAAATVVLVGDRIDNVYRSGEYAVPEGAQVVDARGATIIPGLIDGHTHVAGLADDSFVASADPHAVVDHFMREYLRHGVTTIRDTGNFDPTAALQHVRTHMNGSWPRFYGAGPVLDGPSDPPAPWRWLWLVDDEDAARDQVRRLANLGVDFLKVYMWMREPVLRALIEEAHGLGLRVTGHLGYKVGVERAARLGIDSLEHVRMGPDLLTADQKRALAKLPTRAMDPIASWAAWRFADPVGRKARALIELLLERGVFFTPTLTWSRSILAADIPEVASPPGIEMVPASVRETWSQFSYTFDYTPEDFKLAKVELQRQMEFVGLAAESGVRVVAGTDTTNPSVIPGAALHDELGLLVQCGLTPVAAIHCATLAAAELLGCQSEIGSLEKRKLADVLIVDGALARDIAASRRIRAVFKGGRKVTSEEGAARV